MTRIVVHVAWRPELDLDVDPEERDAQWAEMAGPLVERAVALGGRVVGWTLNELAVDFSWDGLYDAIDFMVDAPLAPELACGMSMGTIHVVHDTGRIALAAGRPVRQAGRLVQVARPGEVLLTPELVEASQGRLGVLGQAGSRPGRPDVDAWVLDPEHPLKDDGLEVPGSTRFLSPSAGQKFPSSRAPESTLARSMDRLAHSAAALHDSEGSVFPAELSSALKKRDASSLHELADSLRSHAEGAADRMEAIAELAEGRSGEALRRLRRSKEQAPSDDATARCRAALALAVALLAAGRPYLAALEGLDGLARAREGEDERGEKACCRFLCQVARALGDETSADAWSALG